MTTATTSTTSWINEAKTGALNGTYLATGYTESGSGWELSGPAIENWPTDGIIIVCSQDKEDLQEAAALRYDAGPLWLAGVRHTHPESKAGKSLTSQWSPLKDVNSEDDARHLARQVIGTFHSRTPVLLELLTSCIRQQRGTPGGSLSGAIHDYVRLLSVAAEFPDHVHELVAQWGLPDNNAAELLEASGPIAIPGTVTPSANYGTMAWDNPSAKSLDEILCEPGTTLCVQSISRHRTPLTSVLTSILAGRSSCKYDTLVVLENQELVIEQMLPRVAESGAVATIVTQRTPLNYIPETPAMRELKEAGCARQFPLD